MLLTYKDVLKKFKNDYGIKKEIGNHRLYKIARGMYSDKKNIDSALIYSKKYNNAIVTMDSAFYYYNLTDVIPDKTYLAVPNNTHIKKEKNIVFNYIDGKIINEGKINAEIYNEKINIYDKERLLIELIRKRNKIPFDYYKEIINNYRKISNTLDIRKLEKYISLFNNSNSISDTLVREVF